MLSKHSITELNPDPNNYVFCVGQKLENASKSSTWELTKEAAAV